MHEHRTDRLAREMDMRRTIIIEHRSGFTFAIPADLLHGVMDAQANGGPVEVRDWMIRVDDCTDGDGGTDAPRGNQ